MKNREPNLAIYKLGDSRKYSRAEWDNNIVETHSVFCPLNPGHQRSSGRLNELTLVLNSSKIGDIIWTWYSECVVTERVAKLLDKEKVTGFELFPVQVSKILHGDRNVRNLPPLFELQLRGWGGMARPECGIHLTESCEGCGHLVYSSFADPSKLIDFKHWDGSDIFMVWPLPRFVFVTDRVRRIVRAKRLRGCILIPVDNLPTNEEQGIIPGLSPGRLRQWMPDDRARELGEPLGIY
jgi:hypothetical protein